MEEGNGTIVISWEFNGAYKAEYAAYTYIFA